MQSLVKTKVWLEAHKKYKPLVFFLAGFLFDLLTLGRIDQLATLLQQAIFLMVLGGLLVVEAFYPNTAPPSLPQWLKKQWHHRIEVLHFLFGGLLSAYTLFYLKSSSLFASFVFILVLAFVMVINELPRFQRTDLSFKFVLYALCIVSYFAYLIPTLLGQMGIWIFLLSIFCASGFLVGLFWLFKKRGATPEFLYKRYALPSGATILLFLIFYFFQWIPPVPLSTEYMGIYHNIKKEKGQYLLYHERPFWRIWHNGDQVFKAAPGDQIYAFAKIFSPTGFKDQVVFHWLRENSRQGWQSMDKVPITIIGGRDQGFRGYAVKSNYSEGEWQVRVETQNGREIGRLYFEVVNIETPAKREFKVETH